MRSSMTTGTRRSTAALVLGLALFLIACGDSTTIGVQAPTCVQDAPRLAGTWTATLTNRVLRVRLTENCEWLGGLFAGAGWVATGDWEWSGMSGPAEIRPFTFSGRAELTLATGPILQYNDRAIFTTDGRFPAGLTLSGTLSGALSTPSGGQSAQIILFDKEPLVLTRQ
jgi:hypothetical protein